MDQLLVEEEAIQTRIHHAREKTLNWFRKLRVEGHPNGVCRSADCHDIERWPGMVLPATYNALMCRALLNALPEDRTSLAAWLLQFRDSTGIFRVPEMNDNEVYKKPCKAETWTYIDFQISNSSLGALESLGVLNHEFPFESAFLEPYLHPLYLEAWLSRRDLRDPLLEGTTIVNLGSFLLLYSKKDEAVASHLLGILMDWHDRMLEPTTGFWGVGQALSEERMIQAMCGSASKYHLYYALDLDIPSFERAVDFCLSLPPRVRTACIDLSAIDILANCFRLGSYREEDIIRWLSAMLNGLLEFQNPDGGFADDVRGVRHFDGWVHGYSEPHGVSNTYAAWLRWLSIAIISDILWPQWETWQFRSMLGSGYFRRD